MFGNRNFDNHERVIFAHDELSGLKAVVAIHNSALGPAFGGCRMWPYSHDDDALTDALRLSRGMTYKATICDLPYGGGKSVIIGNSRTEKTEDLVRAMGRLVESLGGSYIIADDVGTTLADLAIMRRETSHTAAATEAAQSDLAVTAYGVLMGIEATVAQIFDRGDMEGLRFAVQGLGNVGMPLCEHLHARGAKLIVTDVDRARMQVAKDRFGAEVSEPDAIYDADADIFSPCALGAILNPETIPRLKVRAVCGGANNQLLHAEHDEGLARRGIAFVPDYLVNAGGVIDFYQEAIDDRPEAILKSVERIRSIADDILRRARDAGETPMTTADRIVRQRLQAARNRSQSTQQGS